MCVWARVCVRVCVCDSVCTLCVTMCLSSSASASEYLLHRCRGDAACEDDGDRFATLRSGLRTSVEQAVARQKLVNAMLRHPTNGAGANGTGAQLPFV